MQPMCSICHRCPALAPLPSSSCSFLRDLWLVEGRQKGRGRLTWLQSAAFLGESQRLLCHGLQDQLPGPNSPFTEHTIPFPKQNVSLVFHRSCREHSSNSIIYSQSLSLALHFQSLGSQPKNSLSTFSYISVISLAAIPPRS